jgi:hypothetical protein
MAAESLRMLNSLLLTFRFLVLVFRVTGTQPWKTSHFVISWPFSRVRKSDHDCAIEIEYFGLRSKDSGRIGDLLSYSFSLRQ